MAEREPSLEDLGLADGLPHPDDIPDLPPPAEEQRKRPIPVAPAAKRKIDINRYKERKQSPPVDAAHSWGLLANHYISHAMLMALFGGLHAAFYYHYPSTITPDDGLLPGIAKIQFSQLGLSAGVGAVQLAAVLLAIGTGLMVAANSRLNPPHIYMPGHSSAFYWISMIGLVLTYFSSVLLGIFVPVIVSLMLLAHLTSKCLSFVNRL